MWDLKIGGIACYNLLNWFFIYSFFGWIWESLYVSWKEKRLVNRGYVTGPVVTIYGAGAILIYLIFFGSYAQWNFHLVGECLTFCYLFRADNIDY